MFSMSLYNIIFSLYVFFLGAAFASFINLLTDRIPKKKDVINSRSICDYCNHKLSGADLIPIFSFLFFKGKCRYCHKRLSNWYIISEIFIGTLFLIAFLSFDIYNLNTLLYFVLVLFNILIFSYISIFDIKYYIIQNKLVLFLSIFYTIGIILIPLIFNIHYTYIYFILDHIGAGIILFLFFLFLYLITKGKGFGGGDVKLAFPIGVLLGIKPTIIALYCAFIIGAIISIFFIIFKIRGLKDKVPFGPFLAFGVIIAILYSDRILKLNIFYFVTYFSYLLGF